MDALFPQSTKEVALEVCTNCADHLSKIEQITDMRRWTCTIDNFIKTVN